MKIRLAAVAAVLAAVAQSAAAQSAALQPASNDVREGAVMLYFSKSFGSDQARNRSPLAFGLRLQQHATFDQARPIALFDARYSLGGRQQLFVGGLQAFGSEESSDESSSASNKFSAEHPGWTIAMVAGALLVGWCIADLCKSDDDDDDEQVPYVPGQG